jgi:hypothetical protein
LSYSVVGSLTGISLETLAWDIHYFDWNRALGYTERFRNRFALAPNMQAVS